MNIEWTKVNDKIIVDKGNHFETSEGHLIFWGSQDAYEAQNYLSNKSITTYKAPIMKDSLKQDLQALTFNGNVAYLPTEPLNSYLDLKKTLVQATGVYKKNTFVFPTDAKQIVNRMIGGESINFKKDFQFFATPPTLAEYMANKIMFESNEINILEPSAGQGALIDVILSRNEAVKKNIDAVELSEMNFNILVEKYPGINIINGDFITTEFSGKYDIIIANPPFTKNQDIDHIRKMYSLLKDNGQLITIVSKSWTFGSQKKQVEFRKWIDEVGTTEDLEQGTFKSSGTNVSGVLITIYK